MEIDVRPTGAHATLASFEDLHSNERAGAAGRQEQICEYYEGHIRRYTGTMAGYAQGAVLWRRWRLEVFEA